MTGLGKAWVQDSATLPLGSPPEGVTCSSTGLAREQRLNRWRAMAAGPIRQTTQGEGDDPISALIELERRLVVMRGSMSGEPG